MSIGEQQRKLIQTQEAGRVAVHVEPAFRALDGRIQLSQPEPPTLPAREPTSCRLFERTAELGMALSERFPRMTFAAIAFPLLAFIVTAEIEYVRKAGFHWR